MMKLFRFALISLAGVTLLSLAGCGQQTDAAKASKVAFVTTAQNARQQIWYRLNTPTPSKNSQVSDILVQKKGKVNDYQVTGISLNQLNHKSVSQAINLAKNNEERTFNHEVTSKRNNYLGQLKTDKTNQKNSDQYTYKKGIAQANSQAKQDQRLYKQFTQSTHNLHFTATNTYPVTAKVGKNKSGKQVISETIQLSSQKWVYGTATNGTVKQVQQRRDIKLTAQDLMAKPLKISGTQYIGYYSGSGALITKTSNSKAETNFDTPATHGVK
ncbi:hypothetical protein HC026_05245 [Lactobacillus sp. LC28-10]|uniref:Lipoprotein n=1 Tax=Secundilactobacillus angelensis TaxID=2722706 RepID=A0ABX1KWN9_9LACO|nr:hypothetical protein [Secundilactobacillus angelensis]MCH5463438.1 hypothetical protein [Secundilactobacillus angelensis]NLR18331.1 hypothetical protein [Secundilactobacillus angelensis]